MATADHHQPLNPLNLEGELRRLSDTIGQFLSLAQKDLDWRKSQSTVVTIHDLENLGKKLMSEIQTHAAKQNAFNDRLGKAIDGLVADQKTQTDLIKKLQSTPGPISSEDQATLDQLERTAEGFTQKLEALDEMTPPTPTTEPTDGSGGAGGSGGNNPGGGGTGTSGGVGSTDPTTGLPVTPEQASQASAASRNRR